MCKFIMKIMMIRTLWGLKPLQGYIHLRTVYRLWSDGNNGGHSGGGSQADVLQDSRTSLE